jgi:predicted nucleic acid-binding protein
MFLVDTNVISEGRKGARADLTVVNFVMQSEQDIFLPVQVIGELQSGVEMLRQRGDLLQSSQLQKWLQTVLHRYSSRILTFDLECAKLWGNLRGSSDQNLIDKQIAAVALAYDLTVVTRNTSHFAGTGVRMLNPFLPDFEPGKPTN